MLLFFLTHESRLAELGRDGLSAGRMVRLHPSLVAARADGPGPLVVVDTDLMGRMPEVDAVGHPRTAIPAAALANLGPYAAPRPVTAAGGYVMRHRADGPEVLLIFRRGVWDLPKGKQDEGESVEACARREVCEELGIDAVRIVRPLGTTLHGYRRKDRYDVKTTYWYAMTTDAEAFTPQAEEDIEAVAWVPWAEAPARLGYPSLQRHMATVDPAEERPV